MARFCSLFSSSRGNSIYISAAQTCILVDVGVTYKRLLEALREREIPPECICGVLITHEHDDHIRGLRIFLSHYDVPVYSAPETLHALCLAGKIPPHARLVECTGTFQVGDMEVTPFDTPHDAVHSLGFRLSMPDGRTVGIATDLGHISREVEDHLTGCDLVVLESNYDRGMLDCSSYPYYLKHRIKGQNGHLSNDDCSSQISRLVQNGSTRFVLAHLSEQNNHPELAYRSTRSPLDTAGLKENLDYILDVAPARVPGKVLVF